VNRQFLLKVLAMVLPALATGAGSWYTARSDAEKSYEALQGAVQDLQASIKTLESNQDRLWQIALTRAARAAPPLPETPSRPSAAVSTLRPRLGSLGGGAARPAPPAPPAPEPPEPAPVQERLPELKALPESLGKL